MKLGIFRHARFLYDMQVPSIYKTLLRKKQLSWCTKAKKALTNKETLKMAEKGKKIVNQWKSVVLDIVDKEAEKVRALGRLECMICAVALDKKNRKFPKMEDAALDGLEEFGKEVGKVLRAPSAWVDGASDSDKTKPSPKPREQMLMHREYDQHGALKNEKAVLAAMGYQIGVVIQNNEVIGEIKEVKDNEVTLLLRSEPEGGQVKVKTQSLLQNEWKKYVEPKEQTQVAWVSDAPMVSAEFGITVLKANVAQAMYQQAKDLKGYETVQLWKDPKALTVSKSWPPKKLQFPCATGKILVVEPDKASGITIGVYGPYEVCIVPHTKLGSFCNPMWMIPTTEEEENVNMEVRRGRHVKALYSLYGNDAIYIWVLLSEHLYYCVVEFDNTFPLASH